MPISKISSEIKLSVSAYITSALLAVGVAYTMSEETMFVHAPFT